jgi:hypothetical protein
MNSVTKLVTILALVLMPAVLGFKLDSDCTSNGFFRNSEDCTRFYRCVDLTGKGHFRKYTFSCPVGTVFDETVSVCNHPWAAPPCEENTTEGEIVETTTVPEITTVAEIIEEGDSDGDDSLTVIVAPTFDFQCSNQGIFSHASDCARFWLCKMENGKPELYKCPAGYLFSGE